MKRREFLRLGAATVAVSGAITLEAFAQAGPAWAQTTDKKLRIGVVGGRFGLAFHWHEHPNCIVAAVSDLIPERREMLKGKYKCDTVYESLEKLVLDPDIDAVALFTPAPDHARHVILCMEHGKHVISACPACMSLDEAEAMVKVKRRTGLKYMSAETSHYRWETIFARELFRAGNVGAVTYCEAEYYHPAIGREKHELSYMNGQRTWRYGFPPMLYPTHSTAFLVGVTGERLTKVSCLGTGDPDEPSLKDNAYNNPFLNGMALFETDRGNPFRCNVCWDIHAEGERAQWFFERGSIYMPGSGGQPRTLDEDGTRTQELPDYFGRVPEAMRYDSGHGASHPFITNEFVMACVEDREPTIDLYEGLAYCVPGIVAHASALKGGEQMKIPPFSKEGT